MNEVNTDTRADRRLRGPTLIAGLVTAVMLIAMGVTGAVRGAPSEAGPAFTVLLGLALLIALVAGTVAHRLSARRWR